MLATPQESVLSPRLANIAETPLPDPLDGDRTHSA